MGKGPKNADIFVHVTNPTDEQLEDLHGSSFTFESTL